jgi:hypothetical protein
VRLDPPVFKRKQRAARLNAVDQQSSEQKKNTQGIPSA